MGAHNESNNIPLSETIFDKDLGETTHCESTLDLTQDDRDFLESFSDERRKKVLWKLDIRLVPMLSFLYLIAYIDRANIGNAKIEGLMDDLKLSGTQYNIALSVFFIPYILLEMPSNALLLRFKRPSHYLGILIVTWGIVMTLTGLVQNFGGLVACRWFLGVFETGFFPGAVYIISSWYLPNETQLRISVFFSASAMAGAFSGLLAFAIAKLDGVAGVAGWRWIFILEGIASVIAGVLTFWLLVDTPALSGRWLAAEEIRYLELRQLARQGNSLRIRKAEESRKWKIARSVLTDWQIYLQALVYMSNTVPNYGMKFTMPQIIKNMGYTNSTAQLLTIPPYVVGALSAFTSGFLADRYKWRMPFILSAQLIVVVAFAILFSLSANIQIAPCYFAIFLANVGFYPINPGGNAWTLSNLAGPTKRAQGIGFMICLGNIGGVIGSYIYIENEKPIYPTGFGTSFAFAGLGIIACLVLETTYWRLNKQRDGMSEEQIRQRYSEAELEQLGDRSPLFRYSY